MTEELERFRDDARYLEEHRQELLAQYPERWVAIYHQQVVAHAKDPRRLIQKLQEQGIPAARVYRAHLTSHEEMLILAARPMTRGYLAGLPGRRRPYVYDQLTIPTLPAEGEVEWLVDTGADATVLAPNDALALGIDLTRLPVGTPTRGVGGAMPTAVVEASLTLDHQTFALTLRMLVPQTKRQQRALSAIPSLLGRDLWSQFALLNEERSSRVLLLERAEVDGLNLPESW